MFLIERVVVFNKSLLVWPVAFTIFIVLQSCGFSNSSDSKPSSSANITPDSSVNISPGSSAANTSSGSSTSGSSANIAPGSLTNITPDSSADNTTSGSTASNTTSGSSTNFLSGLVQYEDRLFDADGFTGATSLKPLRYADIQIERESDSQVLLKTSTNGEGKYSIDVNDYLEETVRVRCLSSTEKSGKKVTVRSETSDGVLYSIISDPFILQSGENTKNLNATISAGSAEYFNVFETLITGALFIESITGAVLTKSAVGIYPNGADDGTYFDGTNLFICGGCSSDDDGWDDTVILHEFGHLVANAYSKDDSPGGTHSLSSPLEITLAWSEGWATFFASATRSFMSESSPENYVDTTGANGNSIGISYEIETPSKYNTTAFGANYEVAVSTVLWDIFDSNSESEAFDSLSLGVGSSTSGIWEVFSGYLPTVTATNLISLEDFWDGWFGQSQGSLGGANDITGIFQARKIYYRADSKETGNDLLDDDSSDHATNLTVGTALTDGTPSGNLTFYPTGDTDWFSFTYVQGTNYVIETLNLGSGADPIMWLYSNPSGIYKCSNDDVSAGNLNSKLTVPSANCSFSGYQTIYVKIQPSPFSAGNPALYGDYNIKVTSN